MSEPIRLPRELVLASAGSGKTYSLSSLLIALMAGDERPQSIFASTFTRKAAGEILDRVLLRLARAVLDAEQFDELRDATHIDGKPILVDRDHTGRLLRDICGRLHRLNISTLDAFFARVVQSFAFELGMPVGWTIADEVQQSQLRIEAAQQVLDVDDPQPLVELLRMINRGDHERSVHQRLMRLVEELYSLYQQIDFSRGDPFRAVEMPPNVPPLSDSELEQMCEALRTLDLPTTAKGQPVQHWVNACAGALHALSLRRWSELIDNSLCKKIIAGEEAFSKKPITEDVRAAFEPAIQHARLCLLRELIAESHAMGDLMKRFDQAMGRLQHRRQAFRFDDITHAIAIGAEQAGVAEALAYRLDGQIRHVLLDEFQDTSVVQWQALEPLVQEMFHDLGGSRCVSVVADPKQSIYGWRGGEPDIVYEVRQRYNLNDRTLDKSWRSSQVVLDVVNRVFDGIGGTEVINEENRPTVKQWARAFSPHRAARDLPGYVELRTVRKADKDEKDDLVTQQAAAEKVAELAAAHSGATIGVLVRSNKAVANLIYLLRDRGVACSEEGGNPLTDSPAVAAVLALLRLADHPGDKVSRFHVARSPLGEVVGFTDENNGAAAAALAHTVRRQLIRDGYGKLLHQWVEKLADQCGPRDLSRLMQLVEMACRYDEQATIRTGGFVGLVEKTRVADPTTAAVRVMTIHQSKGLEFDIVVLPELDGSYLKGGRGSALIRREDVTGPITAIFPYVDESLRALLEPQAPVLQEMFLDQRGRAIRDSLSGLYVAMTRPRHALHMFIKPAGKQPGTSQSSARLLIEALAPDDKLEPEQIIYSHGDPHWADHLQREPSLPRPVIESPAPKLIDSDRPRRMLPRRTPSQLEGDRQVSVAGLLSLRRRSATTRGTLFHLWFEQIGWLDDGEPSAEQLQQLARRLDTDEADIEQHIEQFQHALRQPNLRQLLTRPSDDLRRTVANEKRFVVNDSSGLLEGSIDRLVIARQGDAIQHIHIIDYKTDTLGDDVEQALATLADHYRPQMAAYRRAVERMYRVPAKSIGGRLAFLAADRVVEL